MIEKNTTGSLGMRESYRECWKSSRVVRPKEEELIALHINNKVGE